MNEYSPSECLPSQSLDQSGPVDQCGPFLSLLSFSSIYGVQSMYFLSCICHLYPVLRSILLLFFP